MSEKVIVNMNINVILAKIKPKIKKKCQVEFRGETLKFNSTTKRFYNDAMVYLEGYINGIMPELSEPILNEEFYQMLIEEGYNYIVKRLNE